jgi:hypothetical protein
LYFLNGDGCKVDRVFSSEFLKFFGRRGGFESWYAPAGIVEALRLSDTGAKSIYKANDAENQFQKRYILLSNDALGGTTGVVRRMEHPCRFDVSGM